MAKISRSVKEEAKRQARYELNEILKEHDVPKMRTFILEHSEFFQKVPDEDIFDDEFVFDLMHVYKSYLIYFGEEQKRSMKYCVDKGIMRVTLPKDIECENSIAESDQEVRH